MAVMRWTLACALTTCLIATATRACLRATFCFRRASVTLPCAHTAKAPTRTGARAHSQTRARSAAGGRAGGGAQSSTTGEEEEEGRTLARA